LYTALEHIAQVIPDACNLPEVIWAEADKQTISRNKKV
jgi:hypothetical protein